MCAQIRSKKLFVVFADSIARTELYACKLTFVIKADKGRKRSDRPIAKRRMCGMLRGSGQGFAIQPTKIGLAKFNGAVWRIDRRIPGFDLGVAIGVVVIEI